MIQGQGHLKVKLSFVTEMVQFTWVLWVSRNKISLKLKNKYNLDLIDILWYPDKSRAFESIVSLLCDIWQGWYERKTRSALDRSTTVWIHCSLVLGLCNLRGLCNDSRCFGGQFGTWIYSMIFLYTLQYQTKNVMDLVCSMSVIYCTVPLILR